MFLPCSSTHLLWMFRVFYILLSSCFLFCSTRLSWPWRLPLDLGCVGGYGEDMHLSRRTGCHGGDGMGLERGLGNVLGRELERGGLGKERGLERGMARERGQGLGTGLGQETRLGRGLGGWSFTLLVLLLLLPPVFPQCPDSCHCVWESSVVLCADAGLREFPQGLPPDTVTLHLERNYIRSLPEGAFRELTHLRELYLSHNRIETLSSGALRHLSSELRLLDLSHNQLRRASRDEFSSTRAKTRLYHNPWHCDCTLQELMETLNLEPETVNGIVCESSVRGAGEGSRWEDPGGAREHAGQPLVKLLDSGVNFCSLQRKTTDVAMLVTMFVWFFMVIVYVVYYVRQNQAETRRHLEYLKSLPSPKKTPTETDTISTGL